MTFAPEHGDGGAVVESVASGTTSGLTAVDRARGGARDAVRVALVAPPGTAIEVVLRSVGFRTSSWPVEPDTLIEALAHAVPHAIILDASAAGADEVLDRLLEERIHPPVIAIGRAGGDQAADHWLAAGADDFLTFDHLVPAIVRRTIESAIARGRARELRQRYSEVDRLAAIATLAAGVAHEVNNPAAYVLMNLRTSRDHLRELHRTLVDDAVGDGTPNPYAPALDEMIEMVDDNIRGVERIVAIVHALRSYARPEPDRLEPVDLAAVCRQAHELLGSQLRHRARVTVELAPVPPVDADPRKLLEVVINLLVNAAEALPPGPADHEIRMRLTTVDDRVELTVTDTGPGLAPDQRGRIFEPFYTTQLRLGSSGLGLATVRAVAERVGGRVAVRSHPDAGSEFVVSLPVRPQARAGAARRARVLIIDDEVPLTSAMRRQLRGHHDVTVINEASTAMARLIEQDFDVILCDVMMPGTDGMALLERLRRERPELVARLVLMTAGVTNPIRDLVRAKGGRLVEKPVPVEQLLALIDELATRRT
ncbi:MAG: response regulator [Kofleriaceae bacterium]